MGGLGGWVALLLLVIGLVITGWLARMVKSMDAAKAKLAFEFDCQKTQASIKEMLRAHEQILRSGAAFFADIDGVTREEWYEFAARQKVTQQLPGIQGIGFAILVPGAQLDAHVAAVRAEGFPEYRVWPEGKRDVYSSIVFLEPFVGRNLRAFGYDMFAEPVRRAAMEMARDEDQATLSGKVKLVQENGQDVQAGTLMYVPVYQMGAARATVAERRAALIGWVYSPYRMNDLMEGSLDHGGLVSQKQIHLQIHDGAGGDPSTLLYDSDPLSSDSPQSETHWTRQVSVNATGRQWLLDFSTNDPAQALGHANSWLTMGAGGTISLLLAGLSLSLANTRRNARTLAEYMTKHLHETSNRLSLAARAGGVGIWDFDVVNNRLDWDDQMYRLYGITQAQFSGAYEAWQAGLHPDDRQRGDAEIQLALQSAKDFDIEFRVLWPDGTIHHIRCFAKVERDAAGNPLRMIGTNWDITAQKLSEVELERLARIQAGLLHLATEFVKIPADRQDAAIGESLATIGQLVTVDRAYLVTYDFAGGLMSIAREWCGPGVPPQIAKQQALPIAPIQDWVASHRRGEVIQISDMAALPQEDPLRQWLETMGIRSLVTLPLMQGGICLGFIGLDVMLEQRIWQTDELALLRMLAELYANFYTRIALEHAARVLQGDLLKAHDAAQASAVAKGLFLANMSHEIRTPLNSVLGYAQIMERECRDCPSRGRLRPITRSGEHLLRLTTDLLEMARAEGKEINIGAREFDFHQMLEDVRLMFVEPLLQQGVTLEVTRAPDVPQFINADPTKVQQVLVNLVGNAAKFTDRGGVCVSVALLGGTAADGVTLAVDVDDTGRGIREDELERIFQVFEQAEYGIKNGKGAGLGLPLSRRYAEALGGGITVTSNLGKGSRFRFTFNAHLVRGSRPARPQLEQVRCLAPEQAPCRLLVVDDEPDNRSMLEVMLTAAGFAVETVASAAQALERLRQARDVNLVLIDKNMPEMSAYEAIPHLRALPGGSELPVLVVSASGFDQEGDVARAAGADGYLAKPVQRKQLLEQIASLTGVLYTYEAAEPAPGTTPAALDAAALTCLSAEQVRRFDQALLRGDAQLLRELIAEIASTHGGVAAGLGLLVDAYDYEGLRRLLDSAKGAGV
jgi:signal transduction histidine kinase/CHASE1-domain containing sensor protein/DNA-binding response OmpR family regulator